MHRILIVDDEPMILTILTESFKQYSKKYAISTAKDGLRAIMALKDRPFDLVITDINMPIINGLVLLAYMHKNFPKIPCIAMTGFGTPFLKKRMREDSVHYIEKPFTINVLLKAIRSVLATGVLSGTLNGISVEGFLKMIELEMITCLCAISSTDSTESNQPEGYLYFEQGKLYQAHYGRLKGKKAALKIFQMNNVMVKFRKPPKYGRISRKITEDIEDLLLEAMVQMDDGVIPEEKRPDKKEQINSVKKKSVLNKGADFDENGDLILTDISRKILES